MESNNGALDIEVYANALEDSSVGLQKDFS
jgi:hypothetical protein